MIFLQKLAVPHFFTMLSPIYDLNPWLVAAGLNTVLLAIAWVAPKKLLTPAG
jgi:hypothetical protein